MIRNVIVARKGGNEIVCGTLTKMGQTIGADASSVCRAISERKLLRGYTIIRVQKEMSGAIVAITTDNEAFRFETLQDASRACMRNSRDTRSVGSSIRNAINHETTYLNLRWMYAEDYRGELADPEGFEQYAVAYGGKRIRKFRSELAPGEKIDKRTPIAYGYYCADFNPVVCPICGKVMGNSDNAVRHLSNCLEGHEYQTILNVIRVYK